MKNKEMLTYTLMSYVKDPQIKIKYSKLRQFNFQKVEIKFF